MAFTQAARLTSRCVTKRIASEPTGRPECLVPSTVQQLRGACRIRKLEDHDIRLYGLGIDPTPSMCDRASASSRAFAWSSCKRAASAPEQSARRSQYARLTHPAAQSLAINPRPLHQFRRAHQHRSHRCAKPFDRQNMIVSNPRVSVFTSSPSAVAALKIRAPSRCTGSFRSFASAQISSIARSGVHRPPAKFAVFSISIKPVAARNELRP